MTGLLARALAVGLAVAAVTFATSGELSFGHHHVGSGHDLHHHHFNVGPHEHFDEQAHDREHDGHDDHDTPAPGERKSPRRTATRRAIPCSG